MSLRLELKDLSQEQMQEALKALYQDRPPEDPALQDLTYQEWAALWLVLTSLMQEKSNAVLQ